MRTVLTCLTLLITASAALAPTPAVAQDEPTGLYNPDSCRDQTLFTDEVSEFPYKAEKAFKDAINNGSLSQTDRQALEKAAEHYVYALTSDEFRAQPTERVKTMKQKYALRSNRTARIVFLDMVIEKCRRVLQQCNVGERLNAIVFLAQLDEEPPNLGKRTPAVPYWKTGLVFLDVIENPNEETMVKTRAALSLARILRHGEGSSEEHDEIFSRSAAALRQIKEGNLPLVHGEGYEWWLAYHLTQTLGEAEAPTNLLLEPVGVQILLDIAADPTQSDFLRAKAFRALSKTPFHEGNGFDIGPIVTLQMRYLQDWISRYNADPIHWENRHVIADMYHSFKPETLEQFESGDGWLAQVEKSANRGSTGPVRAAEQAVFPLYKHVIEAKPAQQKPIGRELVAPINAWLESQPPTGSVHSRVDNVTFQPNPPVEADAAPAS